jgi:sulfate adenylyltransferase
LKDNLIQPHGGTLVDLLADDDRAAAIRQDSSGWLSWNLTPRQLCDLELLANGAFSPLRGYLGRDDYESVCDRLRLADGTLWPVPVTLDLPEELAARIGRGDPLALRDPEGVMLAALRVGEIWRPDLQAEAQRVHGTADPAHPGVDRLLRRTHPVYVSGAVEALRAPVHYDFRNLRLTPAELRRQFVRAGWRKVMAYQAGNSIHRADHAMTLHAAKEVEANLLIHPVVGVTKPGDLDHYTRVHCYEALLSRYPRHTVKLALLPLATRMAGPREALWHAIIRRNYGCTHLVVDQHHASPAGGASGDAYEAPGAAFDLVARHENELAVRPVAPKAMVYVEGDDVYRPADEVAQGERVLTLSRDELRRRLEAGRGIPSWFTFPELAAALQRRHPPRHRQGFTLFFTGLSGAGKSTIANALLVKLLEMGGRPVTLLDGDIVRRNLSSELGFSREHRDINIRRIGFVASEITKNGGIAICAPIAPYDAVRKDVRAMIEPVGGFVLVHVATPLDVCESRDRKGLYAKARAGKIKEFTGISDPYEEPVDAEMVIRTTDLTPEQAAQEVLLHLEREGYVGVNGVR